LKSLSKKEFEDECKKLQSRGKCAILFHNNKIQDINKIDLEYKSDKLLNTKEIEKTVTESTYGVLVNFNISSKFSFVNVEKIMNEILIYLPEDINITITATYDDKKDIEYAKITLIFSQKSTSYLDVLHYLNIFSWLRK
jgi:cell division GTPase FtsZ